MFAHLFDLDAIFDIESLSTSLNSKSEDFETSVSKVSFVQLTGTRTANANKVIGTKIFSLLQEIVKGGKALTSLAMVTNAIRI